MEALQLVRKLEAVLCPYAPSLLKGLSLGADFLPQPNVKEETAHDRLDTVLWNCTDLGEEEEL